ncbi:MAG: hypothetical protein JWP26_1715 [Devosia sp.]|uniref:hypothetical protein n=1 Tax=Devosia sp. TaxID=1871048 RepID=UPI002614BD92|nr:hypothetical protein [Devosia sp.]MDB5586745.1 hypothetical protein [Devosia sp.]
MQDSAGSKIIPTRYGRYLREHEILRVSARIGGDPIQAAEAARREVLVWAQNRSGGQLPTEAWSFEGFEVFAGGRTSVAVRIAGLDSDIWAIRADDPDKIVPGRIWTTEVVIGRHKAEQPRFSLRLLASSQETTLDVSPHVPGLVQQVSENHGLYVNNIDASFEPVDFIDEIDVKTLIDLILDPTRKIPIFVLSSVVQPDGSLSPLIESAGLARATLGIGFVAVVSPEASWALTDYFGRAHSVFSGGVRAYLPGFSRSANPFDHRLIVADQLGTTEAKERCGRWLRLMAAQQSIRANKIGEEVLAFSAIRNSSLKLRQESLVREGATDTEKLVAAEVRISALEKEVAEERTAQDYFDEEAKKSDERARAAEAQHRASVFRIQELLGLLKEKGAPEDEVASVPETWADFTNWCDTVLAGRVALAPAARRGARSPDFEDIALCGRSLLWLANEYRDGRLNGSERDYKDYAIEAGIRNARCGGDEFEFEWQGRRETADWHIKNNSDTRDPRRCLRIYYFWEEETRQVVIADMPAHRRSAVS